MSPTAWTPTVPDEAVVRFLDRFTGVVLSGDVGPLLGQAAVLGGQRHADPSTRALVEQAIRFALADRALVDIGAVRLRTPLSRSSALDVSEWLDGVRTPDGRRVAQRVPS